MSDDRLIDSHLTPIAATASGPAQTNAAVLSGVPGGAVAAGKMTYLEGFDLSGGGATAASIIEVTVTGLAVGTLKYEVPIAAGVTSPAFSTPNGPVYQVRFPTALPASGIGQSITVTVPSFGAGNTNASVVAYGYQAS
jgi:hypothetical protein